MGGYVVSFSTCGTQGWITGSSILKSHSLLCFWKTELLRKGCDMPHPRKVLGDVAGAQEEWPEHDDPTRKPYLRETIGHAKIMFYFAKIAVFVPMHEPIFKSTSTKKLLSDYMGPRLEAFLVFTYVNNYAKWIGDCGLGGSCFSSLGSPGSSAPLTAYSNGNDRYNVLTGYGMNLYKRLADVVERQRLDKSNEVLAGFDGLLLYKFRLGTTIGVNRNDTPAKKAKDESGMHDSRPRYVAFYSDEDKGIRYAKHDDTEVFFSTLKAIDDSDLTPDEKWDLVFYTAQENASVDDIKTMLDNNEIHEVDTKGEAVVDTDEKVGFATI